MHDSIKKYLKKLTTKKHELQLMKQFVLLSSFKTIKKKKKIKFEYSRILLKRKFIGNKMMNH